MLSKSVVVAFLASAILASAACTPPHLGSKDGWALYAWNSPCSKTLSPSYWEHGAVSTDCARAKCYNFNSSTHMNDHMASFAFTTSQGPYLSLHGDGGCTASSHIDNYYGTVMQRATNAAERRTSSFKVCNAPVAL
ncbi:hypothetical protein BJ138DRAFT_1178277 [Hygrophoropsis aurantiaca]|uniref:Uncharacterized protein n=1 Tax=Hygrophoropsis aurantiaca TaxID=72124 RepID=A0ACB8AKS0_9AGAM|nr:hypothetical protein BJ138DRAFT_1178277 [Hygrophoropsis aurantiaca]